MAEELTVGRQLEFPFMTELKLKEEQEVNTYNEEDLIAMFEGADLAWMDLLFIDAWFELKNPKSDLVTEIMIFKDRETEKFYRVERRQDNLFKISNEINRYNVDGQDFLTGAVTEDEEVMVELPEVKQEDNTWVYV